MGGALPIVYVEQPWQYAALRCFPKCILLGWVYLALDVDGLANGCDSQSIDALMIERYMKQNAVGVYGSFFRKPLLGEYPYIG